MIYEALLAPHEVPVGLREIKRALLTYDKIILIDPADRDLMPGTAFAAVALGMPPFFGFGGIRVRPMGKMLGYDEEFERTLAACKQAVKEGLVEVRSTYVDPGNVIAFGSIPIGGYPLHLGFVFDLYRSMAGNPAFLASAIKNQTAGLLKGLEQAPYLSLHGAADTALRGAPALPLLSQIVLAPEQTQRLTEIARARIAAFIKYSGFCEAKQLIPVFSSAVYGDITKQMLHNVQIVLATADEMGVWVRRNRVLELCHEEFLVDAVLDQLSIEEVLKLRSSAWGEQAQAREKLFAAVFEIASETGDQPAFEKRVQDLIAGYRKSSRAVIDERKKLGFQIKCELGAAALGGSAGVAGLMSMQSPLSHIALTLAAGGIWGLRRAQEYVPRLRELQAKEQEMKRGAGFGLQNFYSRIGEARP